MTIEGLPSREFSFTIDLKDSDGVRRHGSFTYKKPSLRVKTDIDKTRARLTEGLPLSEEISIMHMVLATLRHTLTEFPKWWEQKDFGYEFDDTTIPYEIFSKIQEFEDDYLEKVYGNQEEVVKQAKAKKNAKEKQEK